MLGAPAAEIESSRRAPKQARVSWATESTSRPTASSKAADSAVVALDGSRSVHGRLNGVRARTRCASKRVEFIVAYYEPSSADLMNGPALPVRTRRKFPGGFPTQGFQVLEELLFPAPDTRR